MNYMERQQQEEQRQREFAKQAEAYLEKLTKIQTLDDLLAIVRDAAGWALAEHRADNKRKGWDT